MSSQKKKFYVSTPIYFVNDKPHIGHAYTTVAADVLSRYKKMIGYDTFFLTGTDEHGQKIEESAKANDTTPIKLADKNMQNFKNLWKALNINNNDFIRTTEERHKATVVKMFEIMKQNSDIYLGEYSGAYCTPCESYWTETQLIDGNLCPDCGRPTKELKEASYFFKLSKYQDKMLEHIKANPDFIRPESRRNEIVSFISEGLRDLSISRVNFSWGIPVKDDPRHVIYVWIDALVNYLSAINYFDDKSDRKKYWPIDLHIVGKDIIRFHTVYWPCMLMSAGIELPKAVFAHGWWTVDGKKMSKSLGNAIDPNYIISKFSTDAFRYFLMREVPFGLDGDFSYKALTHRINIDLANDLGNLVSRTLGMLQKYCDSTVPEYSIVSDDDKLVYEAMTALPEIVDKHINALAFHKALGAVWDLISLMNKYVDDAKPWALAKDEANRARIGSILYTLLDSIRLITHLMNPFMPEASVTIRKELKLDDDCSVASLDELKKVKLMKKGVKLNSELKPIFPRIDVEEMLKDVDAAKNANTETPKEQLIDFSAFESISIKAGKILAAENVAKSDKLLKLSVDCGDGARIIVSGIAKSFEPADIIGTTVAVVTNLKPVKLMGIESNGMILAVTDDQGKHNLLKLPDHLKAGARIK